MRPWRLSSRSALRWPIQTAGFVWSMGLRPSYSLYAFLLALLDAAQSDYRRDFGSTSANFTTASSLPSLSVTMKALESRSRLI